MRSSRLLLAMIVRFGCLVVLAAATPAALRAEDPPPAEPAAEVQPPESSDAPPTESGESPPAEPAAAPRGPTDPAELESFVDGLMATALEDKHIAGATFAFVVDGKPFFAKGYGHADVEAKKPVDPATTMFRVGSVSKLFTWTALMRLAEEGKLNLDADINEYLEDFKIPATYPEPITSKHLLSHTPGFEDRVIGLFAHSADELEPLGELLARNLPARVRKPGELASYSNHGTAIAGYIVQQVAGRPWEEYIEETILKPLGMKHTTVRQPPEDELPPELSKGYKWEQGRFVEQGFEYVPPAPAGSMSASAGDMVQFMIAHLAGGKNGDVRILNEDTVRTMQGPLFTPDPRLEGMAYGFMRQKYGDELIVEHGGDTFAFHSHFVMLPERNSGYFVSFNTTTAGGARNTLFKSLLDHYYPPADEPVEATSDFAQRADRYRGHYGSIRHAYTTPAKLGALMGAADVTVDDDNLVFTFTGADLVLRFAEVEPGLFREVDGQRMIAFREDGEGPAPYMFLGGSPTAFERLPWYETIRFSLALLVGCLVVFLTALVGWPLAAFINWGHAPERTAVAKFASWLAWLTCLALLAVAGVGAVLFSDPEQIAFGMPPMLTGLVLSTPVVAGLVGAVLLCTLVAWIKSYWRFSGRLHYTVVAAAGLAFVWFLYHWNLVGPVADGLLPPRPTVATLSVCAATDCPSDTDCPPRSPTTDRTAPRMKLRAPARLAPIAQGSVRYPGPGPAAAESGRRRSPG